MATSRKGRKRRAATTDQPFRQTKIVTTLLELPQTLIGILSEIGEREKSQPHVVAHYVIDDRIHFELCPHCAKGGTEKIILRVEGPCSDNLVLKSLFGDAYDQTATVH
jgi:hypothetical protein